MVVGGGIMGVSMAWQLAKRLDDGGAPVVLVERTELGAGSSGRSGAILRQHYSDPEVAAMARDSLRFYASFEALTGASIGFRRCGVLTLAGGNSPAAAENVAMLERNIRMQQSIGIRVECLDTAELRRRFPGWVFADRTVAAWEPEAGFVDPMRAVRAFAARARAAGAVTRLGCPALRLECAGGRVCGVRTTEGLIEAPQVVVAAGPWTRAWLAPHGIELPLECVKPEQLYLASPPVDTRGEDRTFAARAHMDGIEARFASGEHPDDPVAHPVLLDVQNGFYARCEPATARTRVGEMDYHACASVPDPGRLDESVSQAFRSWGRAALARRVPWYADAPEAGTLAGMYTLSPDAQALLGPLPAIEGLYVCAGFSGHGFKLAPSVGEGMAQMLLGEPVSAFDTAFFSPGRFAGGVRAGSRAFGL